MKNRRHGREAALGICLFISATVSPGIADESWKLYDDSEVAVIEIEMDPLDLQWMYENVASDSIHPCTVLFQNAYIDETVYDVGIRLRGNTSRYAEKKSFKLSFNTFVQGREFYDVDKLNLNGEHNDPSIIRSKLSWDFYQKLGMSAPRAAHAAIFINGVYHGLYISVEHIDDEFLSKRFTDDSGNLWKCLWPADLAYLGDDPDLYKLMSDDRRVYDLKSNTDEDDYTQLARLISMINNTPESVLPESLESIIRVPEVLHYLAMNVLAGSWDDYWFLMNNYYLYHEPSLGMFHWIPYDYDNTFSVDWFGIDWAQIDPYDFATIEETQGGTPGFRPLVERIIEVPQYRDLYSHFMEFFLDEVFRLDNWDDSLERMKETITPWAEADTFRTLDYGFTVEDFHRSYTATGYSNQHVKRGLREFVNLRAYTLPAQLVWENAAPIVYDISWAPSLPAPDDTIDVTVAAFAHAGLHSVSIRYSPANGGALEYAMNAQPVSGTTIAREADRWIGSIPPLGPNAEGEFHILSTSTDGQTSQFPHGPGITLRVAQLETSGVVVNELLARNSTSNTDPGGEYDDWLELYNPTANAVDLAGFYLTDDRDDLTQWEFPEETNPLEPGAYLLVWCDDDEDQEGLHTTFKLDGDGEFLAIVSSDGVTVVDSIAFDEQADDISFGRHPDGFESWRFLHPSPGTSNLGNSGAAAPRPVSSTLYATPNPTRGGTTLRFVLVEPGAPTLTIFDLGGRAVWRSALSGLEAGSYTVMWDGCGEDGARLQSGVYICLLGYGSHRATLPVIQIR